MVYILGINSAYHESAACLLADGRVLAFAEEERFNRRKHAKPARIDNPDELPLGAIEYCLREAGIPLARVDAVGYSFNPPKRLLNLNVPEPVREGDWGSREGEQIFQDKLLGVPDRLSELAGEPLGDRFFWLDHHLCHAASAFFVSPFEEAAVLAIDGIGEIATAFLGHGEGGALRKLDELVYPDSLGLLWEKLASFLGFGEYDACKVMGLAAYGDPRVFAGQFASLVRAEAGGGFKMDLGRLCFRSNDMTELEGLFGARRREDEPLEGRHADVAAALQRLTEERVLALARALRERTGSGRLCLAGGVALNCVANRLVQERAGYEEIYVQPAANDAGTALGAACFLACQKFGRPRPEPMLHPYWGPDFSEAEMRAALEEAGLGYRREARIAEAVAGLLERGRVVGWFQGRMEAGPRALGNRSLLADPRRADMRQILNEKVKHRESFRPLAPSILAEKAGEWFRIPAARSCASDFMMFAYEVLPGRAELIPAVLHVDRSSRVQTVRRETNPGFHELLREFERRTGVPLLLNTSFNDQEPIVCSPRDAVHTFLKTRIDVLALAHSSFFGSLPMSAEPRLDPAIPAAALLFKPVWDGYGRRLALVLGNEAAGGRCPFYSRQCHHCDIGAGEGLAFDPAMNGRRLDFFRRHYSEVLPEVRHLVLYNSGSLLNEREFSAASQSAAARFSAELPRCAVVSMDSREQFVSKAALRGLRQSLRPEQSLRIILGLETQSDELRLKVLRKRMTRAALERAFETIGAFAPAIGADINILFAPPPLEGARAIEEAEATAVYALELAKRHGVSVDLNFHPYYPSQIGREHFPSHPRASLADALAALERIQARILESSQEVMLFVGWQDEEHDQEQSLRESELQNYLAIFDRINRTSEKR